MQIQTWKFAFAVSAFAFLAFKGQALSQTCTEPAASDFSTETLVTTGGTLQEEQSGATGPVQIAVAAPNRIFVGLMRTGEVRVYTGTANTTVLAGKVSTYFNTEDGLLGLALDPNFATTNWLYVFASDPATSGANRSCVLYRYTVTSANQLTNQKIILRVTRDSDTHHAAGGLAFASNGSLIISTGDNSDPHDATNGGYGSLNTGRPAADAQKSAANSNDLRGKILRIHPLPFADAQTPTPGVGGTYEIPAGNMFPEGTANTRPEIFTMGHRNPYHPRIDSRSGWIFWGEVGPDASSAGSKGPEGYEEWNLTAKPGFFGWPYCVANNLTYQGQSCTTPVNNSPNNTGIKALPPATLPQIYYSNSHPDARYSGTGETAVGGPMYRFDPNLDSKVKFPAYYEGKIFFFDWSKRGFRVLSPTVNATLPATTDVIKSFAPAGLPTASYIDMQFGPDGAMYLLRFSDNGYTIGGGGGLYRVTYKGTADNSCYKEFKAAVTGPDAGLVSVSNGEMRKTLAPALVGGILTLPAGYSTVRLFDVSGREVWKFQRDRVVDPVQLRLPGNLSKGVLRASFLR
jgi:cytochrome c